MAYTMRVLINDFAIRSFRDTADKDYIAARMAYRARLIQPFLWSALHCLEIRGRTTVLPIRDALRRRRPASASSSAWTRDRQRAATQPQDVGVRRALANLAQTYSADCR